MGNKFILHNQPGIYYIKNTVNDKRYIGSSLNISRRFYQYEYLLRNNKCHSPKLQAAYNKYGKDVFEYGIIEKTETSFLKERERYWIDHFDSVSNGYNCSNNTYCSTRGRKCKPEEISSMSKRNKKRWEQDRNKLLPISKKNLEIALCKRKGSKNSDVHNEAISNANKGKKMPEHVKEFHKDRLLKTPINYWLGKKMSSEVRLKMSVSHTGKKGELHPSSKKIHQFDLNGVLIHEHISAIECERNNPEFKRSGIKECLKGRLKTYKKHIWKYAD